MFTELPEGQTMSCNPHKWVLSISTRKGRRKICKVCGINQNKFYSTVPPNAQRTGDLGRLKFGGTVDRPDLYKHAKSLVNKPSQIFEGPNSSLRKTYNASLGGTDSWQVVYAQWGYTVVSRNQADIDKELKRLTRLGFSPVALPCKIIIKK